MLTAFALAKMGKGRLGEGAYGSCLWGLSRSARFRSSARTGVRNLVAFGDAHPLLRLNDRETAGTAG